MRQEAEAAGRSYKVVPFMSRLSCFQPYEWYGAARQRSPTGTVRDLRPRYVRLTRMNGGPRAVAPAVTGVSTSRDGCDGPGSDPESCPDRPTARPPDRPAYRALMTTVTDE
ncbi:hypothetical protein GCM10022232_66110 [Streptomyces plumbiresistens]|uniref:Uncharacterized protein n=1 Tax=Streptomyces plumbiresistens TaxID=511811 RepID=A0ABP7SP99_9ACTN